MSTHPRNPPNNVVSVRMSPHMRASLARSAGTSGRTLTQYINAVLDRSVLLGGLPGLDEQCVRVIIERIEKASADATPAPAEAPNTTREIPSDDELLFIVHTILLMLQLDFEASGKVHVTNRAVEVVRSKLKARVKG